MCVDKDLEVEYFHRLSERFTPAELIDILDVTVEDIWNAFYEQIIENQTLIVMAGIVEDE
jgi:hypothetical protein